MLDIIENTGRFSSRCRCVVCRQLYDTADRYVAKKAHAGDQCPSCKHLITQPPTQLALLQIFNYDPETGDLTYKRDFFRRHKEDSPLTKHSRGYWVVWLDKSYLAHRIIWFMQTGNWCEQVDHLNHIRTDNRWVNLRAADDKENYYNKSINTNNTSGYLGVSFMKSRGKYRATITKNRKSIHLGLFNTAEEAHQARLDANEDHGFHSNHGQP